MQTNPEKSSLRKILLERRDSTSSDLRKISSEKILKKLFKIPDYKDAESIAAYYPIGSEVLTQDIMLDALSRGKKLYLPRVKDNDLVFKRVKEFGNLERGSFGIMEPKEDCETSTEFDIILVPTVGISPKGVRLGYGYGYYDRFLSKIDSVSIALTYEKQIVKKIPKTENDVLIDWIVTENRHFKTANS